MRRSHYQPARWMPAKFESTCSCGAKIRKGDKMQYHPHGRRAICQDCGEQYERDLAADDFDQAQINGSWSL